MWSTLARVLGRPFAVVDRPSDVRDAIVVLGAALRNDRLTRILKERIAGAVELYRAGAAPRIVTTGGITRGSTRAEATAIAEALVDAGIPRAVIAVEDRSKTTAENARFTALLLGPCRVWLVTQPFHARRAERLFRDAGFDALAWNLGASVQFRDHRRAVRWYLREYAAWAKVLVRRRGR